MIAARLHHGAAVVEIVRRGLRSYRRPLLIWMAALAALGLVLALSWPAVRDAAGLDELLANMPEAVRALIGSQDLLSPAGFLGSRLNSLVPLVITIYAAFRVTSETAAEEQAGGFEIVLGTPVARTSLLLAKLVAVCVSVAALIAALAVALLVGAAVVSMPIASSNVIAAAVALVLLGWAFAGITLAVAGVSGSRGLTLGVGAGLAVALFFLHTFAPLVPALEGLTALTLFQQAVGYEPLRHGLAVGDSVVLAAVAVAGTSIGAVAFRRRDLHGT